MSDNINNDILYDDLFAQVEPQVEQEELHQLQPGDEFQLRPQDICLGGGHGRRLHPGTLRKRGLIIQMFPFYKDKSIERKQLFGIVYDTLTAEGRRFMIEVKMGDGSSWFQEVLREVALERIKGNFNQYQTQMKTKPLIKKAPAPFPAPAPTDNNVIVPNEPPSAPELQKDAPPVQPKTVYPEGLLSAHVGRMEIERSQALEENEKLVKENEKLRTMIAELQAAAATEEQPSVEDIGSRLVESEADRYELEKALKESNAQTSKALAEVKELRKNLAKTTDSVALFQDLVLGVSEPTRNHGDDVTILSGFLESMSFSEEVPTDATVKSGNSNDQQRRKLAKTTNDNGSAPAVRELPRKYDARTIISGLSDWRRSFIDLPQNMQEMKIVEKLRVGNGIYRGSVLRGKPHGLGLLRMKGRTILANWNNGVATGLACVWYGNGDAYFGRLEANEREGNGIYHSTKDCFEYVGPFRKDLRHGEDGHFKFTEGHEMNGHEYKGAFARGVFEGKGTHRYPSGDLKSGRFANWILVEADAIAPAVPAAADG